MDMQQLTKIILASELFNNGLPRTHIASQLGINRDTVRLWLKGICEHGLSGFLEKYETAKKGERRKRRLSPELKGLVYDIREQERDCCGQKIRYFLKEDYNISLGTTTIYKILSEKYQLRSKWKKNQARGPVPHAEKAREVIQMDTVDFGEIFSFNGIDISSKEVDIILRPSLTSHDGLIFLETAMERRFDGHAGLIQADGGPEFKDEFKANVHRFADRYRVAHPYKKNEQSFIESFNRSLRKECLGWSKYKIGQLPELTKEVERYLIWYHQRRPHIGLNMKTPSSITSLPDI